MKPADIGNWGLLQVLREGGRLLRRHCGDFLPAIIVCILPASLISVVHAQNRVDTQGGSTEEAASTFTFVHGLLPALVSALPRFFILLGAVLMFSELTNVVYCDGAGETTTTTRHKEHLFDSITFALGCKDVETENPVLRTTTTESSLYYRIRRTSQGKKLRALAAIFALHIVYFVGAESGEGFTPEAMAARGLPPWTAFLCTLPLALLVTANTSYLTLVHLVMFVWLCSPALESCDPETGLRGRGERASLIVAASNKAWRACPAEVPASNKAWRACPA